MTKLTAEIYLGTDITETEKIYFVRNLLNIEFSGQDRSNPMLPSWGIYSNSGSLEMYDADGDLASLKKEGSLLNSTINIYLVTDTRKEQIGSFIIKKVSEPKQDFIIKIEFSDTLTHWQEIQLPEFYYPYSSTSEDNIFLIDLYKDVARAARVAVSLTTDARVVLEGIYLPVMKLESGSFWAQMNKICEASACYIYCDNQGTPTMYHDGEIYRSNL